MGLQNKKIVFFDIDYTVFNTDTYREELYERFATLYGVKKNAMQLFIKQAIEKTKAKDGYFNPQTFLKQLMLFSKNSIRIEALERIFWDEQLYAKSLYSEVKGVFQDLHEKDVVIGILSTGNTKHQRQKIHLLTDFLVEEHIHIYIDKLAELQRVIRLYTDYSIFIVDDLPKVLKAAKEIDKNVVSILVKKPKMSEQAEHEENFLPDREITNLQEIIPVVLSN